MFSQAIELLLQHGSKQRKRSAQFQLRASVCIRQCTVGCARVPLLCCDLGFHVHAHPHYCWRLSEAWPKDCRVRHLFSRMTCVQFQWQLQLIFNMFSSFISGCCLVTRDSVASSACGWMYGWRTDAAARGSLRRGRPGGLTSPASAFHACQFFSCTL